jgi:hypothetical protein
LVPQEEAVYERCASKHVFHIGGAGSAIIHSIPQAIRGLLEIFHKLVDIVFLSVAVYPAAIQRPIKIGAKRIGVFFDTAHQILHLLIAQAVWPLLRLYGHAKAREREHNCQSQTVSQSLHK